DSLIATCGAYLFAGLGIQHHHCAGQFGARSRIATHDLWIMSGYDVLRRRHTGPYGLERFYHFAHMERRCKWPACLDVFVIMRSIGGYGNPTTTSMHPHELEPRSMATHRMDGDARRQFGIAVVETHPFLVVEPHELGNIIDVITV